MKRYFVDPVSNNLIIADDKGQVSVIEAMKNVRVFVAGGEAYMTEGHEENELQSSVPPKGKRPHNADAPRSYKCGKCGSAGHTARKCTN